MGTFSSGHSPKGAVDGYNRHKAGRAGEHEFQLHPKTFVFFDQATGTKRFEIKANADGSLPAEQATSLLAMQCVVRGQNPSDFHIMVSVGENLMGALVPRTNKLIEACMATVLPVHISQRQQEVLRGILQNLSNKEIAAKLNLAERTVKFHVSALLQKFHVTGRGGLMQKAGDLLSGSRSPLDNRSSELLGPMSQRALPEVNSLGPKLLQLTAGEMRSSSR
jgi:DNA-binding CsgD family transcriptional regulator